MPVSHRRGESHALSSPGSSPPPWPLPCFAAAIFVTGEGIDAFGAHWYVVSAAGSAVKRGGDAYVSGEFDVRGSC